MKKYFLYKDWKKLTLVKYNPQSELYFSIFSIQVSEALSKNENRIVKCVQEHERLPVANDIIKKSTKAGWMLGTVWKRSLGCPHPTSECFISHPYFVSNSRLQGMCPMGSSRR